MTGRALACLALGLVHCGKPSAPPAPAATVSMASATPAPDASAAASVRGHTILLLGDSHSYGAFGQRLHAHLASRGRYAVWSEAAGGASTDTYLEAHPEATAGYRVRASDAGDDTPREIRSAIASPMKNLEELLALHDPVIVVVALGTNRPRTPLAESCVNLMRLLVRDRPERRIYWVGPPAFGADGARAISDGLSECVRAFPGATFLESRSFNARTPLPADNPHFGPDDAKRWADAIGARMLIDAPTR